MGGHKGSPYIFYNTLKNIKANIFVIKYNQLNNR